MARLTDKTTATAVTLNSLVHIVNTNDISQSSTGSSYKADLGQLGVAMGGYQYYTAITVTSAEILTSNSSPVELLPNPGAGNYYDAKYVSEFTYNTTTYIGGIVSITDSNLGSIYQIGDFATMTSDLISIKISTEAQLQMIPNSPIYLYTASSDPTTGDGEFLIKIWYSIKTMG
jgi:hypothetical protein